MRQGSVRRGILKFFRGVMRLVTRPRITWLDPAARELLNGGAVMVCNHNSTTNGLMLPAAFRKDLVPVVAKDWYEKPQWHAWLEAYGCVPVDRYGLDTQWVRLAAGAIREGRTVLIFPEGRVRKDDVLNEFKPGFALLAAMTGVPVIPVSICGRYTPLKPARLVVGSPVRLERSGAMRSEYLTGQSALLRETVAENKQKWKRSKDQHE